MVLRRKTWLSQFETLWRCLSYRPGVEEEEQGAEEMEKQEVEEMEKQVKEEETFML